MAVNSREINIYAFPIQSCKLFQMGLRIIPGGIYIHLHWDLRTKHDVSLSLHVSLIKIYIVVEPFRHPSLQDDSYQLKNDIGVNPTFWTEEMCHYAESPFRLFPFGKLVKSLKDCVEFQFSGPGWLPHLKQFGIVVTWSLEPPATCTGSSQVPIGKHWRFLYFLSVIFKITSCTSCQ